MDNKDKLAKVISTLFHPLIIPTLGYFLLLNSGFYFSLISVKAKLLILVVVFISTFVLPLSSILLMTLTGRFNINMEKSTERVLPYLMSALFYYFGFYTLGQISLFTVYKIFLIISILVLIALALISIRWKISAHLAAIGGVIGAYIALSLRLGENTSIAICLLIIIAGLIASSRLILKKHNSLQIYAGFLLGFALNFIMIYLL